MRESASLRYRAPMCLILAGFLLLMGRPTSATTILVDSSIIDTIDGVSTENTHGNMMVGMMVTAQFSNRLPEALSWIATMGDSGGVFGTDWSLTVDGDTYRPNPDGADWIFTNSTGELLESLTLYGAPGLTVFDRNFGFDPGDFFTPNSFFGLDFAESPVTAGTATYSHPVAIGLNAPLNDIYHMLMLDFTQAASGPGGIAGNWTFVQDTDNHLVVPEPSTILLMGLGLLGIGAGALRRRK